MHKEARMANNSPQAKQVVQSKDSETIQRTKNVDEVPGIDGFAYDQIISWNGQEGVHQGVTFIIDNSIRYMYASLNPPIVRFNVNDVGGMTPPARYFMMCMNYHIAYQHPGNLDAQGQVSRKYS